MSGVDGPDDEGSIGELGEELPCVIPGGPCAHGGVLGLDDEAIAPGNLALGQEEIPDVANGTSGRAQVSE